MEGPEVHGDEADSGGGVMFTPGYELAYEIDPDGDTEAVFTDWTQESIAEGDGAACSDSEPIL